MFDEYYEIAEQIAVDIVLSPSEEIMDNAIEVNQALAGARITYIDAGLFR